MKNVLHLPFDNEGYQDITTGRAIERTGDGKLRHPRFLGLRRDKPAKEVAREEPAD